MKQLSFVLAVLTMLILALPVSAAQPEAPDYPITMGMTSKPVVFSHDAHAARECADCHHPAGGNANYSSCATDGCHDVLGRRDKTEHSYYRIVHERRVQHNSCLSCHYEAADNSGLRKALTSCSRSACHP